jgi:exopolysaccharide biosynthesis polyprenyl glycosylphosphotransferase
MIMSIDSFFCLSLAISIAAISLSGNTPAGNPGSLLQTRLTLVDLCVCTTFAVLWIKCFDFVSLTRTRCQGTLRAMIRAIWVAALMACIAFAFLLFRRASAIFSVVSLVFAAALLYEIARVVIARVRRSLMPSGARVVILGTGRRASKAWREIRTRHAGVRELVGFVDYRSREEMPPDIAARYLTDPAHFADFLLNHTVDELVVAVPIRSCYDIAQQCVSIAEAAGVRVLYLRDIYTLSHSTEIRRRMDAALELIPSDQLRDLRQGFKRSFDLTIALLLLCVISPVFLLIAIAVKLTSRGPVFFVQERYGFRRRRFRMYKFRSMVHNAPELMASLESHNEAVGPIFKLRNDPRITPLGKLLRRWSLDELPQLINVIRGEMSLVGPRPMSVRDVSRFSEAALMRRFSIRPGITGMWQVSGRSSLTFDEWIALDFQYIEDWSLELDFRILARTVPAVLRGWGAA